MRVLGNGLRQPPRQHRVDLNSGHGGATVEQSQRERAEAGTDLQDEIGPTDPGGRDDAPHSVGIVHEVLSERFPWPEIKFFGQPPDLGAPE
jgi:hypothetical protein